MQIHPKVIVFLFFSLILFFQRPDALGKSDFGTLTVFRNHDPSTSFTEPYRGIIRTGDDFESELESAIHNAKNSVDVAVYELRLPKVAKALATQFKAGLKIRVILDNTNRRSWSSYSPKEVANLNEHDLPRYQDAIKFIDQNSDGTISTVEALDRDAIKILEAAGVPIIDDTSDGSKGSGLMHHKFMVIDGVEVWTGSANFTTSCTQGDSNHPMSRGNANGMIRVFNKDFANLFSDEFSEMWSHRFGLKKKYRGAKSVRIADSIEITIQFSPASEKKIGWNATPNALIERTLLSANQSIDLALFVFSEQRLVNAMLPLKNKMGNIRALVDPSFAYRNYSELLDLMGLQYLDANCKYEPGNKPWATPVQTVGIPILPNGDLLHYKLAIIDNKKTIFGSHNWSLAANQTNDETLLIIDHIATAQLFTEEMNQLSTNSFWGPSRNLLNKISDQEKSCYPAQSE